MNWYKVSKLSGELAGNPYGAWLSPSGELKLVKFQDHFDEAARIISKTPYDFFKNYFDSKGIEITKENESKLRSSLLQDGAEILDKIYETGPYELIFASGWIRIVFEEDVLSIDNSAKKMTEDQKNKLKNLIEYLNMKVLYEEKSDDSLEGMKFFQYPNAAIDFLDGSGQKKVYESPFAKFR